LKSTGFLFLLKIEEKVHDQKTCEANTSIAMTDFISILRISSFITDARDEVKVLSDMSARTSK